MLSFFNLSCLLLVRAAIGKPCAQRDYNACPEESACLIEESLLTGVIGQRGGKAWPTAPVMYAHYVVALRRLCCEL